MGCVASKPQALSTATRDTSPIQTQLPPLETEELYNANQVQEPATHRYDTTVTPGEPMLQVSGSALLAMAMESLEESVPVQKGQASRNGTDASSQSIGASSPSTTTAIGGKTENAVHDLPDLSYTIRSNPRDTSTSGPSTTGMGTPSGGPTTGLSPNVIVNRPVFRNLQPGAVSPEFPNPHAATLLRPMQPFVTGSPSFVPMHYPFHVPVTSGAPTANLPSPARPLAPLEPVGMPFAGQPPLLSGASQPTVAIGRGRGGVHLGGPMPVLPGRGVPYPGGPAPQRQVPVMIGRGRGQPYPDGVPFNINARSRIDPAPIASKHEDNSENESDNDDDEDDLIDEGEEVEDWDLAGDDAGSAERSDTATLNEDNKNDHSTRVQVQSVAALESKPVSPVRKFRPGEQFVDDTIESVESDSNGDSESDDGNDDLDDGVSDWLDADPEPIKEIKSSAQPKVIQVSPPKLQRQSESSKRVVSVTTPHESPTKNPPTFAPSPSSRMLGPHGAFVGPTHPPFGSQQPSLRQLNGSPTRPPGPPPTGGSPLKPPSYRSNIVPSGMPMIVPLTVQAEAMSSSALTTSHHGDSANRITPTNGSTPIRDTKVVKKKRAELPQGKLPHPAPKFGDWLNSRTMINNYIILESLGAGSYAEVKLCKEKVTGKLFAMKFINRDIMKKDKLGKQSKLDDIKREIAIMKKLNHPNVLRLYEVMDDPKMNKLFLVLEYMKHGDLLGYQKKKHPHQIDDNFNDRDLHSVFLQVILGLAYLHEQKIVHGDIKPQNLLVGDKDIVKIADFGISQSLYGSKQKLNDSVGTPAFMSPEMCSGQEYSGQLADIWAVGATIFMLKYGHPPFLAKSAMEMFERIQNDQLVFPGPLDPSLEDLLRGMLTKNAQKRMTLLQIMTHPWVTKEENPLRQQLLLHEKPQQITVTKEEIENAINVGDRFAIIINIRVQMKKHLKRARQRIMERRASGSNSKSLVTSTKTSITDQNVKHGNTASRNTNTSKVFIDAASADSEADGCRKMLSDEEIEYRSLLFTRKKPSVAGSPSGTTPTAFLTSTADEKASVTQPATVDGDEEDAFSDDDDDQAVAQSPQLLDELLLTTLSMPPLSKTASTPMPNASNPKAFLSPVESVYNTNKSSGIICGDAQCEEESESLRLQIAVSSLQGRRNTQEDRYTVLPTVDCPESAHWSGSAFVGLYDGHGGEECSTILQEQLHDWLFRSPDDHLATSQRIQKSFTEFDAFICDYLLHKGDLSGSTATCVFFDRVNSDPERKKWRLIIAHVGDCRLVLSRRNGDTVDLTRDHRLTLTEERERILQLGGRVVNNRVNGVMAITRAFGDLEFKGRLGKRSNSSSMTLLPDAVQQNPFQDDERIPPLLTAQPDVEVVDVDGTTDEFLILACDGLWDVMTSDEATSILRDRVHYHGHLQLAAKELAQEGIRRYSNDNITVLVVRFR